MRTAPAQWRSHDTGHRVWPGPLAGALLLGLGAGVLSFTPAGEDLEQRFGLWTLFQLRGPVAPPPEVVIVAMPRDTGERISLRRDRTDADPCADLRVDETPPTHRTLGDVPERWSRCHHVELMRRLKTAPPRVIAVDVTFRPRDDLPRTEDRALGREIRESGNVVLAQKMKFKRGADGGAHAEDGPVELSRDVAGAALGAAPMPLPQLASNRFDQFWTFKSAGYETPSLPALALQVYAIDAYAALRSGLQRIAPEAALALPRDADEMLRDGQLQVHMLHLRSVFLNLPEFSRARLRQTAGATLEQDQVRKLDALIALYTGADTRYFDFYGPPGSLRTVHIADTLSQPRPRVQGLRGKAVFVGYADNTEWEMLEKFATVYGSGTDKTSGVELVATAFANLLEDKGPVPTPAWARFAIAFAAGAGAALLCYAAASLPATLAVMLCAVAYMGMAVLSFAWFDLWLPVFVPVALAAPLGCIYAAGYKLVDYRHDRAALRDILNQFVPPEVVDTLARNANRLGWARETTNAACVMTDVEGFTALSSGLEPAQVADLLCEYFEAIFKPVADHGGFVSDLKGDSILALWTDRQSDPAVREHACDACLDLRAAVDRFNDAHPQSALPTRIGVSYGRVSLGLLGAHPHHEWRAVGDTVNTASRVEQLSKDLGTRLLVTQPVIHGLQQFLVRDLGDFSLRGRRLPTRILELLARNSEASADELQLCQRFAEAKTYHGAGERERARIAFEAILKDFPGDGASAHFLDLIERTR